MFASNGDDFVFHDKTLKDGEGDIEKTLTLEEFPSPAELWKKYRAYRVIKVHLDVDIDGYPPRPGEKDITGAVIPDQVHNQKDFEQNLVIDTRTKRVARWVSDFFKQSGDRCHG